MTIEPTQLAADMAKGTQGSWVSGDEYNLNSVYSVMDGFIAMSVGDSEKAEANARRIARLPELESAYLAITTRVAELEAMLTALVELNDGAGPFGGELFQDRINRTWEKARAVLAQLGVVE